MNSTDNHSVIITNRKIVFLKLDQDKSFGFHLTRSKWDPYPWVGYVEEKSIADIAGIRTGDCLLKIDGLDIVGFKIKQIALFIQNKESGIVNLELWHNFEQDESSGINNTGVLVSGPLPILANKLVKAISGTVCALECPICLEIAISPVSQCVYGHILCANCRIKTTKCPICRIKLGRGRCLIADKIHKYIKDAFDDDFKSGSIKEKKLSLREKLFGKRKIPNNNDNNFHLNATKSCSSFARLFIGGFNKTVSAENLSLSNSELINTSFNQQKSLISPKLGQLSENFRKKSASTGFLNDDTISNQINKRNDINVSTSNWGDSIDSFANYNSFICPMAYKNFCQESINFLNVMEHLGNCHSISQIHFYGSKISFPITFIDETFLLIIHYQEELFFFQHKNEISWLSSAIGKGEWILSGIINDNEIIFKRLINQLNNHKPNLPCYLAPLPNSIVLNLEINLSLNEI